MAAKHYRVKEAFADWDVLKDIAKEVKGKGEVSNDLTRWAAASALEAIGYSQQSLQHLEGGGFTEPLDRIRREIRDRKLTEINRIQRLNTRGETTAEYQRNLEFWLYGPVEELFAGNDRSPNYQELVKDVIRELHGRGVYLGLISPNSIVQGAALRQAELIFKESAEIEDFIYGLLEEFLDNSNHETSLRIHAAEIINTATDVNRRLKNLSKLLLEERNPKLHEVALRQAQQAFHHYAEDFIYGLLEAFLDNSNNEIALRIYAAEIINTTTDLSRRLKTLSQLLLEKIELRNAAVRLLTPYKHDLTRLEPDADTILKALVFSYSLNTLQKPQLQDLTISQLETYVSSASQYHREISAIFTSAIPASESLARRYGRNSSVVKQFLENKQDEYLSPLESWIQILRNQISETETDNTKVQSNQALINKTIDFMCELSETEYSYRSDLPFPIPKKVCILDQKIVLSSTDSHTYNQNCQIQRDLKSINFYLLKFLKEKEKKDIESHKCEFNFVHLLSGLIMSFWSYSAVLLPPLLIPLLIVVGIAILLIKNRQKEEKKLKYLQSIIHKLNTQWKE